jgi:DNA-binding response OmpR family regulator
MNGESGRSENRILVVTRDPVIEQEARYGFPADVEVLIASDSREAASILERCVPDVVVVDIHTGSAGGFSLARDMSDDPKVATVPLVMLLDRPQDSWLADQAGAALVRIKPLSGASLVHDILELIGRTTAA